MIKDPAVFGANDSGKATTHSVIQIQASHDHLQPIYCCVVTFFAERTENEKKSLIIVEMPTWVTAQGFNFFTLSDGFTFNAYDSHLTCVKQLLSSVHNTLTQREISEKRSM